MIAGGCMHGMHPYIRIIATALGKHFFRTLIVVQSTVKFNTSPHSHLLETTGLLSIWKDGRSLRIGTSREKAILSIRSE